MRVAAVTGAVETRGCDRARWVSGEVEMAFESFSSHCWRLVVRDIVEC